MTAMTGGAHTAGMTSTGNVIATVSGNDLLQRLDSVSTGLAKIEAKVDTMPAHIALLESRAEVNSQRIAVLERWRSFWVGVTSVVVILLTSGVVAAFVTAAHR